MNLIGIDFSINKPAMSAYINDKLYFYVWPISIDDKSLNILIENNVNVTNRNLSSVNEKDSTLLNQIHILRAIDLSKLIVNDIKKIIDNNSKTLIATEGLSFGSTGDAALNLAMYKSIFLSNVVTELNITDFYTYAPITIKSIAGCAKKSENKKENMINAFINEPVMHKLMSTINDNPEKLKKKTNYIQTIDDIVDSYFCLKTLHNKLKLNYIEQWQTQLK